MMTLDIHDAELTLIRLILIYLTYKIHIRLYKMHLMLSSAHNVAVCPRKNVQILLESV